MQATNKQLYKQQNKHPKDHLRSKWSQVACNQALQSFAYRCLQAN